jgi:hypothetical protein
MKIVAWCKDCDARLEGSPPAPLRCPECGKEVVPFSEPGVCVVCGYDHFHVRKDFPRQLGLAIVLVAGALCFTNIFPPGLFFLPLIIASVIDLLLYQVIPWKTVCYVCETEYRGAPIDPSLRPFDLATATECKRLRWPKARADGADLKQS